jgi:antitoxin component of MazEF toxin-antitoxin module
MTKKLTAIGNSLGVIIERPILDLLGIDRETELEIKTDGAGLYICPVQRDRATSLKESTFRMINVHDETLKKLAK